MKKLLALILATVMLLSLVACGQTKPSGDATTESTEAITAATEGLKQEVTMDATKTYKKEITMSTWAPISDIDPTAGLQNTVHKVYQNFVYNQLVYLDLNTGEFRGELAAEFKVESPSSYYFKLRDDVKFANGEPLTAEDVKYSLLERPRDESTAERPAKVTLYTWIADIEIINDLELRITTPNPDAEFLYRIYKGDSSIFNKDAVKADPENGWKIGTGGFICESIAASDHVVLTKVADSWVWKVEGETPTEKVTLKYVPENSIASCQAGEVANALCGIADINGYLKDDPNVETYFFAGLARIYYCYNVKADGDSILKDDVYLRQAISYAINRDDFIDFATDGTSHVALSTWGEKQAGYFEDYEKPYGYDLEYAKELMAKSTYKEGTVLRIATLKSRADQAALIAENLKALGIVSEITAYDSTGGSAIRQAGEGYDMYLTDDTYGLNATGKMGWWTTGTKTSGTHVDNAEIKELFTKLSGATTTEEAKEYAKQIQILEKEICTYVPLCYMMTGVMWAKGVSGLDWSIDTNFDWHHVMWEEV